MTVTRLIKPTSELQSSHASFVAEFLERGEQLVPWVLEEVGDSFDNYVAWLDSSSRGRNLPESFVPNSTFWLVDDEDEIVAVSNLRHELTENLVRFGGHIGFGVRPSMRRRGYGVEVLRQTLAEARALGIGDIRVTCDRENLGSARVIVRNGGQIDDEEYMEEHAHVVQRYWIRL